jgi:DNA-binding NarL/FixJ family response regulator
MDQKTRPGWSLLSPSSRLLVGDHSSAGMELSMISRNDWHRTDPDQSPTCTEPAGRFDCMSRNWNILLLSNVGEDNSILLRTLFLQNVPHHVRRASSRPQANAFILNEIYDAIVVFLEPTVTSGLEACRELASAHPEIPIVLLARDLDDNLLSRCIDFGAQDCLAYNHEIRNDLRRAIRLAIDRMRKRRSSVPTGPVAMTDADAVTRVAQLTDRQREVLDLLVQGKPLKQIAALLEIGVQTATKHRAQILKKCEVDSVAQLVRLAFAAGLSIV